MATLMNTTAVDATKGSIYFTPTPTTHAFSRLLGALAGYVEAERDIDHVDAWNPAFLEWQRDAARSRDHVLSLLDLIRNASPVRVEDRPLKRMALLTRMMIESERADEFAQLHGLLDIFPDLFQCSGRGAIVSRVNQMLATARDRLWDIAGLQEYLDVARADDEDAAVAPLSLAM
ncbi:MAG: hypothetical protein V7668_07160 [Cereibacter changlensis]|uniref:Uncharacterized protein n=2 Tax=Cereibacter changlensis TaxID=402884 RepID=A0A2T4JQC4_9RHOB|nr:hypothetical protein [Cereibacter changlensis]PTE19967.1 hypothetical protein C5F48_20070 [Cereibacter changlensis JA139]PZX46879.1 hypothetical protein LX76_04608 [Cereibacter changlensis]